MKIEDFEAMNYDQICKRAEELEIEAMKLQKSLSEHRLIEAPRGWPYCMTGFRPEVTLEKLAGKIAVKDLLDNARLIRKEARVYESASFKTYSMLDKLAGALEITGTIIKELKRLGLEDPVDKATDTVERLSRFLRFYDLNSSDLYKDHIREELNQLNKDLAFL